MKKPGAFRNSHLSVGGKLGSTYRKVLAYFTILFLKKKKKVELCSAITRAAYSKLGYFAWIKLEQTRD